MVHELAHAWIETTFEAKDRQAFMQLRRLDTWTGGDQWKERGAEQAAEILTWGLMDRDISIRWVESNPDSTTSDTRRLFKITNSSPDQLVTAYEHLTGVQPTDRLADDPAHHEPGVGVTSPEATRAG